MINKRFIAGALLLSGYCSLLHAEGPADSAYTFTGKIEGMSKGWVYLYHRQTDKTDSVQVKNGHFIIKGFAAQPEYCLFGVPGPDNKKDFPLEFFLQGGELTLTAKKYSLRTAIIKGVPVQDEFVSFQAGQKDLDEAEARLDKIYGSARMKGNQQQMDSVNKAFEATEARRHQYVKDYIEYHPKGFAVLGISLDNNKDKWLAAIKKDQLEWTHVSDLKGWQNSVAELYGIKAIPMNFLPDKEGKIIAKGLRDEDLEKKLAELVK